MKRASLMIAALVAMVSVPAFAEDGHVSKATLRSLGLGGMQVMSDADGMQVRGLSSNAASGGSSLVAGQLAFNDASGTQFVIGSDFNTSRATAVNAGLNASSTSSHNQGSGLILTLGPIVNAAGLQFTGTFAGQAGQVTAPGFAGSGFALGF
ncbi:MAG TPA: hypothetical protein VFV87_04985 [Pirellulaceae bacterium]|nr:hypothetical protein [Pirellulaceae bacterium]